MNLLNLNTKSQQDFEEIVICPCISISTHQQSGCEKTCIDNIKANQSPQNIHLSGKISGQTSKHSRIFQISKLPLTSNPKKSVAKIKIEYDYNENNLQSFIDTLAEKLESTENTDECFEEFSKVFHSALDKTCKLETPKTTKQNCINNPWITTGIIKSMTTNDEQSFIDTLAEKLESTENTDACFEAFSKVFHSALDKTCKLETPKTTKRNCINNPWITTGSLNP